MGFTYIYPTDFDNNFTYNPLNYSVNNVEITNEYLVSHFLQVTGGSLTGNLNLINGANYYLNSTLLDFSALSGLTAGTVTASKIVQVDANKDIASFRNLTATGNLICNSNGNFICNNSSNTNTGIFYNNNNTTTAQGQFVGNWASANYWGFGNNSTSSDNTVKLGIVTSSSTGAWATSGTTLANLNIGGLLLNSSTVNSTATELNYLSGVTPGTALANLALVTGPFNNISGLFNVSATSLTGNLLSPSSITLTNGNCALNGSNPLTLTNSAALSSAGSTANITIDTTSGNIDIRNSNSGGTTLLSLYANSSRQLTCINNANIVNFPNHNGSSTGISLAGTLVTATATQLNYTTVTPGTASASKALVLDSSSNISGINTVGTTGAITTSFANATSTLVPYQVLNNSSVPITYATQLSNVGVWSGTSTNHPYRLATNNTVRVYISEGGFINLGATTGQTTYTTQVAGSLNTTSFYLGGTQVTSTASELNYNAGITLGLASASKVLSCDSSLNCVGVNKFLISNSTASAWATNSVIANYGLAVCSNVNTSTDQLGSSICFANNSATNVTPDGGIHVNKVSTSVADMYIALKDSTTSVRNIMRLQPTGTMILNNATSQGLNSAGGFLTIQCDTGSNQDSPYSKAVFCRSDHPTDPVSIVMSVNNNASTTSTNSGFIGTFSNSDLRWGTGNSTKACLQYSTGYFGLGTTSPVVPLDVATSGTSRTFDVGGLGYGQLSKTTTTFSIGPVTTNITAQFSNSVLLSTGSYYTISDQRIKKNFTEIKDTTSFIRNVNPCLFEYRNDSGQKYLGYKAQDVAKESIELINFIDNPNMKVEDEGDIEGVQLSVDYTKVCCLLHRAMQVLLNRVDELEALIKK